MFVCCFYQCKRRGAGTGYNVTECGSPFHSAPVGDITASETEISVCCVYPCIKGDLGLVTECGSGEQRAGQQSLHGKGGREGGL